QKGGYQVCNLQVVHVLEREVRLAVDAFVGQYHQLCVTSVRVHCIYERPRREESGNPNIEPGIGAWRRRNVISVNDQDRNVRELLSGASTRPLKASYGGPSCRWLPDYLNQNSKAALERGYRD